MLQWSRIDKNTLSRQVIVYGDNMIKRCSWVSSDPLYQAYHDREWAREKGTDQEHFEQLCLEGAQAGLSWLTILRKRPNYRQAFHNFDLFLCAKLTDAELGAIMTHPGVVKHRLKIYSVRSNALASLALVEEFSSLKGYFWNWLEHGPITHLIDPKIKYAPTTKLAESISKDLKKRGFSYVGPTVVYAFMQAVGMVVDHTTECFLTSS